MLEKVSGEDALDTILQSGTDLFNVLYTTMYDLTEQSDVGFRIKDLKSLWNEIMDALDADRKTLGLFVPLLTLLQIRSALLKAGDLVAEWSEDRLLDTDALIDDLMVQVRKTGHMVIVHPKRFYDAATPSPAKVAWDTLVAATVELKQAIHTANIAFGHSTGLIGMPKTGFPKEEPDLAQKIADANRAFGKWTQLINDPKFAPAKPSFEVKFWNWVRTTIEDIADEINRRGGPTILPPSRMGEGPVDKAARRAHLTDEEMENAASLITALKGIKIPPGLENDAFVLQVYEEAVSAYFRNKFTVLKRRVRGVTDVTKRRQIFVDVTKEVFLFQARQLAEARSKGSVIGKHIAQIMSSDGEKFQKQYDEILKVVAGDSNKPFSELSARQQAEVTKHMVQLLPDMKQVSRAAKLLQLASKAEKTLFGLTVATTVFQVATAGNKQRELTAQSAVLTLDAACSHVARWGAQLGLNRVGNKANPRRVAILSVAMAAWALCSYFSEQEIMEIFGPDGTIWKVPGSDGPSLE